MAKCSTFIALIVYFILDGVVTTRMNTDMGRFDWHLKAARGSCSASAEEMTKNIEESNQTWTEITIIITHKCWWRWRWIFWRKNRIKHKQRIRLHLQLAPTMPRQLRDVSYTEFVIRTLEVNFVCWAMQWSYFRLGRVFAMTTRWHERYTRIYFYRKTTQFTIFVGKKRTARHKFLTTLN